MTANQGSYSRLKSGRMIILSYFLLGVTALIVAFYISHNHDQFND